MLGDSFSLDFLCWVWNLKISVFEKTFYNGSGIFKSSDDWTWLLKPSYTIWGATDLLIKFKFYNKKKKKFYFHHLDKDRLLRYL